MGGESTLWLPGRVERGHKRRAYCIWGALVWLMIGYAAWVIYSAVKDRENPSVSVTLERKRYDFPDVSICFFEDMGCDTNETVKCAESPMEQDLAREAFAGEADGFLVAGNATVLEITASTSEFFANCLEFTLSELELLPGIDDIDLDPKVSLRLRWLTTEDADAQPRPRYYSKVVTIYLTEGGQPLLNETPGVQVPYNRFDDSEELTLAMVTSMNMELIETRFLSGGTEKQYGASSLVQFEYEYTDQGWSVDFGNALHGLLLLEIRQPKLSHTLLTENDPVQPATIVGSIGGTWEIILIIWGIIFISNQRQPPDLKGRNFVKSARRVLKLGRSKEDSASNATVTEENVPSWESESRIGSSTERFSPTQKGLVAAASGFFPKNNGDLGESTRTLGGRPVLPTSQNQTRLFPSNRRPIPLNSASFPSGRRALRGGGMTLVDESQEGTPEGEEDDRRTQQRQ